MLDREYAVEDIELGINARQNASDSGGDAAIRGVFSEEEGIYKLHK